MTRGRKISVLSLLLASCTGGFAASRGQPRDFIDQIPAEDLVCPVGPDCAIGGDCSLYECPEHWVCEELADGERVCVAPGPDYPDEGEWQCEDVDGRTICTGSNFPDGGGGDGWSCERAGDLVVCTREHPDYPDGGGGDAWSCWYEGDLRVCTTTPMIPDDGG